MWSKTYASVLLVILMYACRSVIGKTDKVVCYYLNANGYIFAPPEDLDPQLCTHINYAFLTLQDDGTMVIKDPKLDIDQDLLNRVAKMKEKNGNLKVLFSAQVAAATFSAIAADRTKRQKFVDSSIRLLQQFKYDGVDIDWEYPKKDSDKVNFINLLREMREKFGQNYLITAAVRAIPDDHGYDVKAIMKYVDFVNIMCYDFYGPWSAYTGQNSPLFASSVESAYEKKYLNTAAGATNWKAAGGVPEKMVIGVPFYGRAFTLADKNKHGLHAPITKEKAKQPTPTYYQICKGYDNWHTVWDDEQKVPYKYLENQWVGYENDRSLQEKINYITGQSYAGVMIWHIGADDIQGTCGEKQKALKILNRGLKS